MSSKLLRPPEWIRQINSINPDSDVTQADFFMTKLRTLSSKHRPKSIDPKQFDVQTSLGLFKQDHFGRVFINGYSRTLIV